MAPKLHSVGAGYKLSLSAPLNRLHAILSPLHPSNVCDRECDWEALSRPTSHPPRAGRNTWLPHPKPLRRLNHAIVVLYCLKPLRKKARKNAIEAAIVDRLLDLD